jgi:PPOX class probable F420-dependent enzyme
VADPIWQEKSSFMAESMVAGTAITPEIRSWLMEKLRYPVLATVGSDGMPSQSVMWFDLDPDRDDVVLMNTLMGRLKEQQLRRDNRLSLCFEEGYDYVTLEGWAELDDSRDEALAQIKDLARRYDSNPEKFNGQERVKIVMHVERVIQHE